MKDYPPVSDAPKFGTIVKLPSEDGTEKEYTVVTSHGTSVEYGHKIEKALKDGTQKRPLYHTQNQVETHTGAAKEGGKNGGVILYLGMDKEIEFIQPKGITQMRMVDLPGNDYGNERFENSYTPLMVDGEYGLKSKKYQVVYKERPSVQNKPGISGAYGRRREAEARINAQMQNVQNQNKNDV